MRCALVVVVVVVIILTHTHFFLNSAFVSHDSEANVLEVEKQLASLQARYTALEAAHFDLQLKLQQMTERAEAAERRLTLGGVAASSIPSGAPSQADIEKIPQAVVEAEVSRVRREIKKSQHQESEGVRERSGSRVGDLQEEVAMEKFEKLWLKGGSRYDYGDWRYLKMPGRALVAKVDGYQMETGDSVIDSLQVPGSYELAELNNNIPYYETYLFNIKHVHFVGFTGLGAFADIPVVISVEVASVTRGAKLRRKPVLAIVRSPEERKQLCLSGMRESVCRLPYDAPTLQEYISRTFPGNRFTEVTAPELHTALSKALVAYEQMHIVKTYKVGVLRWVKGQTENEAFANPESDEFNEFMGWLAERVQLKGWAKFRGGLNVTEDVTGTLGVVCSLFVCFCSFWAERQIFVLHDAASKR